ncbi:hypothetical protein K457DRAFT_443716 [Linnemannia elongata AG-77]|uniref:Uncharacterized protein n=1 Tax=Linnemannia elongata AG-77 TaxID=1314771 RepID=A0A197JYG3_9FUNG|nr:hypothetical protein K457DRAFT_443716 [Linnemannia elongata AG-77]
MATVGSETRSTKKTKLTAATCLSTVYWEQFFFLGRCFFFFFSSSFGRFITFVCSFRAFDVMSIFLLSHTLSSFCAVHLKLSCTSILFRLRSFHNHLLNSLVRSTQSVAMLNVLDCLPLLDFVLLFLLGM